jgi:peptidyl-prolyl cis-trans isomerase C
LPAGAVRDVPTAAAALVLAARMCIIRCRVRGRPEPAATVLIGRGGWPVRMAPPLTRALGRLTVVLAAVAPLATRAESDSDPAVAIVDGAAIGRNEVLREIAALPAHYRQLPVERLYPVVLNRLIDSRLLVAEALRRGLQDDARVRRRLDRMRAQVLQQELLDRQVRASVTEAAVRDGYDDFVRNNPSTRQVSARHILVETEAEAWQVIRELAAGSDFAALAQARSIGPGAAKGGDLGYFGPGEVLQPVADAAFRLQPGRVSERPIESPFGWHVVKVEAVRERQPLSFEAARRELTVALSRQAIAALVGELRDRARITRFAIDGGPAPEGLFDVPAGIELPAAALPGPAP